MRGKRDYEQFVSNRVKEIQRRVASNGGIFQQKKIRQTWHQEDVVHRIYLLFVVCT